ncbi:MAG: hypothetical protein ACI91R_000150 [Vicingaceae bacterium]|jgi:hypothetical protein|tara:strand:- start:17 stop:565 length:549 start_codon:yes stop_codon:yes gene_type:complete
MKYFIPLFFILFSVNAYGQKTEQNDKKITELNRRLDNLLGTSKTISGDSVNYKLDRLFLEIKTIKEDVQSIQESIGELKTNGLPSSNAAKLAAINSKIADTESGGYYVVIASERTKDRAELFSTKWSSTYALKIVKNVRETWYHVILEEPLSMRSAIQTVSDIQEKDVKDVWWVNSKKLTDI